MPRLIHVTTVSHTLHFLTGQISFMRQQGLDVEAVSSVDSKLDLFLRKEPIDHHGISMSRSLSPFRDLMSCTRLWKVFRSRRPDIVHAHTPKAGLLSMIAATLAGVPVRIYHIHGNRFATMRGWKRSLIIRCEQLACHLATQVLCVSPSAGREAVQQRIVSNEKIKVLLHGSINGMDAEGRFDPDSLAVTSRNTTRRRMDIPDDAIVVGFIGRLVRDKGIEELAVAWKTIREQYEDAHLLIIGDYEAEDPVDSKIRAMLQSDDRVHCVAYDPETPPLFHAMDVFCLPTYREGLPYVILEASAMRLPIVATRVTGCVDAVVDGETGTLVTVGDPAALSAALARYVEDASLRQWHGAAGRRRVVDQFQPSAMWHVVYEEYSRLLRAAGRPALRPQTVFPKAA